MCGPVGIQGGGGGVVASLADEVFVVASQGGVVAWGEDRIDDHCAVFVWCVWRVRECLGDAGDCVGGPR